MQQAALHLTADGNASLIPNSSLRTCRNQYSSYPASTGTVIDIDDEHHYIKDVRDCSVRMESILLDVNVK